MCFLGWTLRWVKEMDRGTASICQEFLDKGRCSALPGCPRVHRRKPFWWQLEAVGRGGAKSWVDLGSVEVLWDSVFGALWSIDIRCKDGRFPVPASSVTISNPDLVYRSEKGVDYGTRSEKALVWMSSTSGSQWWCLAYKEVKSWCSTTWYRSWQFQTPA